jgi:hypothetical protein
MGLTFKWDGDINLSNGTFKVNDVPIGSGGEDTYYINTGKFVMDDWNNNAVIEEIAIPNFRGIATYKDKIVACFTNKIELYTSMKEFEAGTPEKVKNLSEIEFHNYSGIITTPSELEGIGTIAIKANEVFEPEDIENLTAICLIAQGQVYVHWRAIDEDFFTTKKPEISLIERAESVNHPFLINNALYLLTNRHLSDGNVTTDLMVYDGAVKEGQYSKQIDICFSGGEDYKITDANQLQVSKNVYIIKGTDGNGKLVVGYLNGFHEKMIVQDNEYSYITHACVFDNKLIYIERFSNSEPESYFKYINGTNFMSQLISDQAQFVIPYNPNNYIVNTGDVLAMISTENYMLIRYGGEINKTLIFNKDLEYTPCELEFNDFDKIIETNDGLCLIDRDRIIKIAFEKRAVDLQTALAMIK